MVWTGPLLISVTHGMPAFCNMDTKTLVCCGLSALSAVAVFFLLIIGGSELNSKNTQGVGVLTDMTVKRFNVCEGRISFATRKKEQIITNITLPCAQSSANNTGLPIDISYNSDKPYNVAYNDVSGVLDGCSGCTGTGGAKSMLIACAPLGVLALFFALMAYIFHKAPRASRGAVAPELGAAQA